MSVLRVHGLPVPPALLEFALELRGANPALLAAFAEHTKAAAQLATDEMLGCDTERLPTFQGRAIGLHALATLLADPEAVRRRITPSR